MTSEIVCRFIVIVCLSLLMGVTSGCGRASDQSTNDMPLQEEKKAKLGAATISGTITYEGKVPPPKAIKMEADPVCLKQHTEPVYPKVLVLGEGNTMANVFVKVKSGLPEGVSYPVPKEPVILDQAGCQYKPHVFGIRARQSLKILNPDGTLHNVHAMPKINKAFNMAMPKYRKEAQKSFDKAESMFAIQCDVHPWMGSWVSVMEHPFFDVSAQDGTFRIENLKAGTYEIEAWHEKLGSQVVSVTIGADDTKSVDFTFSRP